MKTNFLIGAAARQPRFRRLTPYLNIILILFLAVLQSHFILGFEMQQGDLQLNNVYTSGSYSNSSDGNYLLHNTQGQLAAINVSNAIYHLQEGIFYILNAFLLPETWQLAVMLMMIMPAGLLMYYSQTMEKEHDVLKTMFFLLFIYYMILVINVFTLFTGSESGNMAIFNRTMLYVFTIGLGPLITLYILYQMIMKVTGVVKYIKNNR